MENPEKPSGPSLFRLVMFKATEKESHKKNVKTDKAKDDTNDFDLNFDDVDLGWTLKASSKALQTIAVGKQLSSGSLGSSAMSNTASASGAGALMRRPRPVVSQVLRWPLRMQRCGTSCCARSRRH